MRSSVKEALVGWRPPKHASTSSSYEREVKAFEEKYGASPASFKKKAKEDAERKKAERAREKAEEARAKKERADARAEKKASRATKDPNAPKKPISAFMFYCKEQRAKVRWVPGRRSRASALAPPQNCVSPRSRRVLERKPRCRRSQKS